MLGDDQVQEASNKVTVGDYFIFVPLPCPDEQAYAKAESFMDQICSHAEQAHFKVIIVRSCYDEVKNLEESQKSGWWWKQILNLPDHYKTFIDQGSVRIVDSYPDLPVQYTPQGMFYRDGKVEWQGQLNTADPASVITEVTEEPSEN